MSNKRKERIPAAEVEQLNRWRPPSWNDGAAGDYWPETNQETKHEDTLAETDVEAEAEQVVEPMTAEQLEAIGKEAFDEGYQDGFEVGQKEGFKAGKESGYQEGHQQGQEAGHQQGHEDGLAKGKQEADAQYRDEWQQRLASFEQLIKKLQQPLDDQQDQLEAALINLVIALTRSVIKREAKIDRAQLQQVIQRAIDQLPMGEQAHTLYMHPDDLATWQAMGEPEDQWKLVPESSLQPGGIKIKSEHSLVDYSVETRFQLAVQQLLDQQMQQDVHIDEAEEDRLTNLNLEDDDADRPA